MEIAGVDVVARGASVRGPRGAVFENLDVDVDPGGLLVVHGPGGSGRTTVLLALAGRMRLDGGAVRVGGHALPRGGRRVRGLVAVARAEPAVGLDPDLRVRELVAERRWLSRRRGAGARLDEAFSVLGIDVDPRTLVRDLPPVEALGVALALALATRPAVIVADDVDRGCPAEERARAWQLVGLVLKAGCTVLAGALDPPGPGVGLHPAPGLVALPRRSRLPERPAQADEPDASSRIPRRVLGRRGPEDGDARASREGEGT
ncbi:ATP-binding cassette domain-containing protein [Kitasatospora sp. NPDC101157]|uniref:ATP-binding cassette domain-containing protein n=1 Tax=Kitasatospora sp. NPDC101157 TaxID=3364098 RepID=UPI00382745AE